MIKENQITKFWSLTAEDTASFWKTNVKTGLFNSEAEERLVTYGRNIIESTKKTPRLVIFWRQLASPLIIILITAGVITFLLAHYRDSIFIFIAVVVNSILGFWQENKAERALVELKSYLKQRTIVIRDGKERKIEAEGVVPGDLIRLAQGDRVPADSRIFYANDLQVDEAILTGESLPITKIIEPVPELSGLGDRKSMVFAGTLVTQGVCSAIVCRTGTKTELGEIAFSIGSVEAEKTPLQKAVAAFSIKLSLFLGLLTVVVFVGGVFIGQPILEMFLISVALAVSAVPEGLPVSMTVILAVGVERMAKKKGVVRRMIAAEVLGSTTVILTDKTGTLTMAKMTLSKAIPFRGPEESLFTKALSGVSVLIENPESNPNDWRMSGRIIEIALVRAAARRGMSVPEIFNEKQILRFIPFNSVQKFSVAVVAEGDKHLAIFFGAPDVLISRSNLSEIKKFELLGEISKIASSGERVLGVAVKEIHNISQFSNSKILQEKALLFEGLLTFSDPVRPGIKEVVDRIRNAGVRTMILTGDHQGTALAVAKEIGLTVSEKSILDASTLITLSEEDLEKRLPDLVVVSRVTPSDKLKIAKLLQKSGEIVAMTGDGVNDAPSIKQADIGIAMGSGTGVAQSVADLVLLDDNFETIVSAIEEGRQILANIRKVFVYLLSSVMDGLILIGGSLVVGLPLPLNALQILWVNFFSDSFPAIAFAFEKDTGHLERRPQKGKMILFDPLTKFLILVIGLFTSALLLSLYFILIRLGYEEDLVKTFTFAAFGTYTLLVALSVRSLDRGIFSYSLFSNLYLLGGILIGVILMAATIYIPWFQLLFNTVALPFTWLIGVILIGIFNIILIEMAKRFFNRPQEDSLLREIIQ